MLTVDIAHSQSGEQRSDGAIYLPPAGGGGGLPDRRRGRARAGAGPARGHGEGLGRELPAGQGLCRTRITLR